MHPTSEANYFERTVEEEDYGVLNSVNQELPQATFFSTLAQMNMIQDNIAKRMWVDYQAYLARQRWEKNQERRAKEFIYDSLKPKYCNNIWDVRLCSLFTRLDTWSLSHYICFITIAFANSLLDTRIFQH